MNASATARQIEKVIDEAMELEPVTRARVTYAVYKAINEALLVNWNDYAPIGKAKLDDYRLDIQREGRLAILNAHRTNK